MVTHGMGAGALAAAAAWLCLAAAAWRLASPAAFAAWREALAVAACGAALAGCAMAALRHPRLAAAAVLASAALLGASRLPEPLPRESVEARPAALEGLLLAWGPSRPGWLRAECRLAAADAEAWSCARILRVEGRWEGPEPLRVGERLRLEGVWQGTPERPWLGLARLLPSGARVWLPLHALRQALRERLDARLAPAHAGVARALLLADWEGLPDALREAYRRLGLLHLLAVSGMHFWIWDGLLRRLPGTRRAARRWPLLLVLGALAGAGPAVVRALAALLLREGAARLGRAVAPLRLWSAALLLECAAGSPARQGLGFVLSYAATGALLAAPPPAHASAVQRALHASAAATCGGLPVLHALRGTLEPWSVVATPLCALALPAKLLLAAAALLPGLARAAGVALDGIGALEDALLALLDRFPGTPLACPDLPPLQTALGSACVLVSLRSHGQARGRAAAVCGLAAAALFLLHAERGPRAGLLLLPVGHGLGAVVRGEAGTLLYDLGSRGRDPADLVDRVALPELARLGWPAPRAAVLSHADADHAAALELLAARGPLRRFDAGPGEDLRLEGFFPYSVRLLGTRPAVAGVRNAGGPVLELRARGPGGALARAVVLGDQFGGALRELRARLEPGPVDLLVLPHHGLTTDGLGELLDHLRPREAWASCGAEELPLPAAPLCARRGIPLRTTAAGALLWVPHRSHPRPAGPSEP